MALMLLLSFALSASADVPVKGILTLQDKEGTELDKQDSVYVIDQGTTAYMTVVWDDSIAADIKYTKFKGEGTRIHIESGLSTPKDTVRFPYTFLYDDTVTITALGYDRAETPDVPGTPGTPLGELIYQTNAITVKVNKGSDPTPPAPGPDPSPDPAPEKSGGGGGCATGFAGFALLFAVPLSYTLKSIKRH